MHPGLNIFLSPRETLASSMEWKIAKPDPSSCKDNSFDGFFFATLDPSIGLFSAEVSSIVLFSQL
jgi:hypothetical protein